MFNKIIYLVLFIFTSFSFLAQEKYTAHNKGKYFILWGGNKDNYTKSDIHFQGKDYDFTLENVVANDVPKGWHIDYINPTRLTIPQNNFKIGYFLNDSYSISIGFDHMKYVLTQDQIVRINGYYPKPGSYGELLSNDQIKVTERFLSYEHTDGLNYINTELSKHIDFSKLIGIKNTDKIQLNLVFGLGVGILMPRTDATLLNKQRSDDFTLAGFGFSTKTALNLTFLKYFFIQCELKGGYINMPNIRTTNSKEDKASQSFYFSQQIFVVGGIFKL